MKSKLVKILLIFAVIGLVGSYLAYNNKYHVKKFVKSNELLYSLAKTVDKLKSEVIKSAKSEAMPSFQPDLNKRHFTVMVDAGKSLGGFNRFWGGIGYESFKSGILTRRNRLLFELIQDTNSRTKNAFRYVRSHNLLSDGKPPFGEGLNVYREDENGNPIYSWTLVDQAFDRILKSGLIPIVELGFMPDDLASIPDKRQRWGKGNISPPKDYDKWENLIYELVSHLQDRYGADEIEKWYFEVWNEPDLELFWIEDPDNKPWGDLNEYFKLYLHTVKSVKAVNPNLRVGGPASAGGGVDLLLEHLVLEKDNTEAIDFVSTHVYGPVGRAGKFEGDESFLSNVYWKLGRALNHDHKRVKETANGLPFLLTEIGPTTRGSNFYNSRYYAAWLIKMVDGFFYMKDFLGDVYLPESVILWSDKHVVKYFAEHNGIASVTNVENSPERIFKRPIYNAFEALGHLGNERIGLSGSQFGDLVHGIATRTQDKSVEVLIYSLNESDMRNAIEDSIKIDLTIKNLPFRNFQINTYKIDKSNSNGYRVWQSLGGLKRLTIKQANYLDSHDDLIQSQPQKTIRSDANEFSDEFVIQSNSIMLLKLIKQN